ncbi:MAG: hypothetical protein IIB57_16330 [Planctomycetes bacterium]|nr:hypothetical protein [Planctomycetota bacterium]
MRDSKRALLAVMESDGVWSDQERIEFERCLERSKTQYAITEQVGGHAFEIIVELPGSVIAHNGDSIEYDKTRDTSLVKWEFDGGAFRDRPHSLAAVSRIAHD